MSVGRKLLVGKRAAPHRERVERAGMHASTSNHSTSTAAARRPRRADAGLFRHAAARTHPRPPVRSISSRSHPAPTNLALEPYHGRSITCCLKTKIIAWFAWAGREFLGVATTNFDSGSSSSGFGGHSRPGHSTGPGFVACRCKPLQKIRRLRYSAPVRVRYVGAYRSCHLKRRLPCKGQPEANPSWAA